MLIIWTTFFRFLPQQLQCLSRVPSSQDDLDFTNNTQTVLYTVWQGRSHQQCSNSTQYYILQGMSCQQSSNSTPYNHLTMYILPTILGQYSIPFDKVCLVNNTLTILIITFYKVYLVNNTLTVLYSFDDVCLINNTLTVLNITFYKVYLANNTQTVLYYIWQCMFIIVFHRCIRALSRYFGKISLAQKYQNVEILGLIWIPTVLTRWYILQEFFGSLNFEKEWAEGKKSWKITQHTKS